MDALTYVTSFGAEVPQSSPEGKGREARNSVKYRAL